MKPLIGILAHPPYTFEKNPFNQISCNYTDSIYQAGGIPIIIPQIDDENLLKECADKIDGLLIPGGIDVNPMMYHENPLPHLGTTSTQYDKWECHMIETCEKKQMPILGICRGMQILNVFHGGTLWQDLSYRKENAFLHNQTEDRGYASHSIDLVEKSYLESIFGKKLDVNSFHHQAVKDVAKNFVVSAYAEDGVIEGIEDPTYPYLVGVQWHPEGFVRTSGVMMPLFKDFVMHCKKDVL